MRILLSLSPLGERVARDGAFFSRRGTGEGVVGTKKAGLAHPSLSPLGETVARDGAFFSRRGTGEGVVKSEESSRQKAEGTSY